MTYLNSFILFASGGILILALGTAHLWLTYKLAFNKAILAGFVPFIAVEMIKAAVAAGFCSIKK